LRYKIMAKTSKSSRPFEASMRFGYKRALKIYLNPL
jgi:hypothetical protein